jgi:hypothetical protein
MAAGDNADVLIAELVKEGVTVAYYMRDGSTARATYRHDNARPVVLDVEDTLRASKEQGKLIMVDSIDGENDFTMDTFISPDQAIAVRVEEAGDLLGAMK